jgi:hypothetical protein
MDEQLLFRAAALHKGKLKPAEFRLRPTDKGLSLFCYKDRPFSESALDAVRAMGKQGDLAVAILRADELQSLGIKLVKTPGATGDPEFDAAHVEARLPWAIRFWLFLRGKRPYDYFNEVLAPRLCALARVQR